jgi:serine/threonine-protein kinase RsbW
MTMTDQNRPRATDLGNRVELTVPASAAYVSVLRTVAASLAVKRDFTIDEIDDLRIAVDEACALLLDRAGRPRHLTASFDGDDVSLVVTVTIADSPHGQPAQAVGAGGAGGDGGLVDERSFAWMVLSALADDLSTHVDDHSASITLTKIRSLRSR